MMEGRLWDVWQYCWQPCLYDSPLSQEAAYQLTVSVQRILSFTDATTSQSVLLSLWRGVQLLDKFSQPLTDTCNL